MPALTTETGSAQGVVLELPHAAPVTRRDPAVQRRRPRAVGVILLLFGTILVVGPIAGGVFADVASGRQMLDDFGPRLQAGRLDGYRDDVRLLRDAVTGLSQVYDAGTVKVGQFPAIDTYRREGPAIVGRADDVLARMSSGVPDYRQVSAIGGFDRIPLLLVILGIVVLVAGVQTLAARPTTARRSLIAAVIVGAILVVYPLASGLINAGAPAERMLTTLEPVMNADAVRQLQQDFVVVVTAVGVLDTDFGSVAAAAPGSGAINDLRSQWPRVSGDLADLVGTMNDNLANYHALGDLDNLSRPLGVGGFAAMGGTLVGAGALIAVTAVAGLIPRRRPRRKGIDR